ncbi:hypothetical protein FKW31_03140 [Acetobacter sp. DmW_136]|uniref:hypothetical protein n=1 Tax=Acetobacter sp. DmW_136 TaxID=2591091 RepID=UPI00123A0915|nr:hypothetical protein [Acetobacter sp. DmW_136]KAA8387654.1 hypothetical protein FKW31_03140 [Acetobacter sp. DmW_136]
MTNQKPTGVFIRLPLSDVQIMKLYNPNGSGNENLLAIGTPVVSGEISGIIHKLISAGIRKALKTTWEGGVFAMHAKSDLLAQETITEMPCALAALAQRDAEIVRLREYYEASEAINQVGILGATPEMFDRENIARKALKGPDA